MTGLALDGAGRMKSEYMALVRRRQMYSGLMMIVFVAMLAAGFGLADSRNAGGFWEGLPKLFDFPAELISEAFEKSAAMPANLLRYLPAMIETINIAAVSTLVGALFAIVLSLLSTRGLARWPAMIPLFRRMMDVMRAVPEIVIALVLIFVMGGGPVPAMIAITFHTAGALGKLFS